MGYSGKALDKMSIMSYQAKKGPDFSVSLQRSIFCYGFHIDVAGSYACFRHLVSQIIYFLLEQAALQWFEFYVIFPKAVEDYM